MPFKSCCAPGYSVLELLFSLHNKQATVILEAEGRNAILLCFSVDCFQSDQRE